ncbi:hypothetical protein E8E12_011094 [Didymella heteroderae]|uniref:Uncharacterized protein n=1 Tax=Didymella heteroderae TaxID=1769908 RepID=A0A9P4WZW3_9PLEO|nr:hypothetical protein E8E12_011094 [Didymella heteroderae]
MGDVKVPLAKRRPGIALVRPRLHNNTQENRDLFKRWARLHMRDTLSIPKDGVLGGASRVLRYTRLTEDGEEEYLFTIVLDDVQLPGTNRFQNVPQRLDLENTRVLDEGEEPVLQEGDLRAGTKPMVFSVVSPSVGIFEAVADVSIIKHPHKSYQHEITKLVTEADPSTYMLITVTMAITKDIPTPDLPYERLRDSLVHTLTGATQQLVHATLYYHASDAQTSMLPKISKGEDGRGEWLICALVGGDRDSGVKDLAEEFMEDQYGDWARRRVLESAEGWRKGLENEGALKEVQLKVGVWKGDIFMS